MKLYKTVLQALAAAGVCCIAGLSPASAQEHAGKSEYMIACAGCHGESAMGQGPFTEWLNVDVPGLTGLAAANDGEFPFLEVFMIVDGRGGIRGHGGTMPIWGDRFSTSAREDFDIYGAEVVTRGRIAVLVDYLQSIQE